MRPQARAGFLGAAVIALALLGGCHRKPSQIKPRISDVVSTDANADAESIGQVDTSHRGQAAPVAAFTGPDGKPATLADFRGKPLLVNLWATWCGPCVKEMPTLDALAKADDRFRLIAVSQDLQGQGVAPFLAQHGLADLKPYLDAKNALMGALGADTLPTTLFYDASGRERWRVVGAMDWSGKRAKTLLDGALGS